MKLICKKCGAQMYVQSALEVDECPDCNNKFNHLEYNEEELLNKEFTREQSRNFVKNNCEQIVFEDGHSKVLLEFATGVGKTINAINIQKRLLDDWGLENTVVFVPEVSHIKNWSDEYKKHGYLDLLKKINSIKSRCKIT